MANQNSIFYGNLTKGIYTKSRNFCDYDNNCITVAEIEDNILNYVTTVAELIAAVAAGGLIRIAPGTYSLTSTLNLQSNTKIVGSGEGNTIITSANAISLLTITSKANITIQNLTLGSDTFTLNCISASGAASQYITLNQLRILNDGNASKINITAGIVSYWIIDNCYFNQSDTQGIVSSSFSFNNTNFSNNYIDDIIQSSTFSFRNPIDQGIIYNIISTLYTSIRSAGTNGNINDCICGNLDLSEIETSIIDNVQLIEGNFAAQIPANVNGSNNEFIINSVIAKSSTQSNINFNVNLINAIDVVVKNSIFNSPARMLFPIAASTNRINNLCNLTTTQNISASTLNTVNIVYGNRINITNTTGGTVNRALNSYSLYTVGATVIVQTDAGNTGTVELNNVGSADGSFTGLSLAADKHSTIMWIGFKWIWIDQGTATLIS